MPSLGEIEEQVNNTPGTLDVQPFTDSGLANSYFDMFFVVTIPELELQLHTITPKRMSSVISRKPPGPGAVYENREDSQLYFPDGSPSGYWLSATHHRPRPQCERGDTDDDGDLDLEDFVGFYACFNGPAVGPPDPDCVRCFDYDGDGDVDLFDWGVFQRLFGVFPG
jgi:hypothetical protein